MRAMQYFVRNVAPGVPRANIFRFWGTCMFMEGRGRNGCERISLPELRRVDSGGWRSRAKAQAFLGALPRELLRRSPLGAAGEKAVSRIDGNALGGFGVSPGLF